MAGAGKKRGQGEGSVYQRASDGLWCGSISLGFDGSGKRIRKQVTDRTKTGALAKLRKLQAEVTTTGKAAEDRSQNATVALLLTEWLETIIRPNRTFSTYEAYESKVRLYLIPKLGRYRVRELEPEHVLKAVNRIRTETGSAIVAAKSRSVLRTALAHAIRLRWVTYNAASATEAPRMPDRVEREWSDQDAATILAAIQGHELEDLIIAQMATGMRIGEILALRFQDVLRENGSIVAVQVVYKLQSHRPIGRVGNNQDGLELPRVYELTHPKTRKARRTLEVSQVAADALERAITTTRARDAAGYPQRSRTPDGLTRQAAEWGLIFRTTNGTPHTAQNVRNAMKRIMKATGFPSLTTHDLRRIYTTLLDNAGVPLPVIQENLGHSRPDTTLRYSKPTREARRFAADTIDSKLGAAKKSPVAEEVATPDTQNPRRTRKKPAYPIYRGRRKRPAGSDINP